MLKCLKLKPQFKVTLRYVGSYKSKKFKKGDEYRLTLQQEGRRVKPHKARYGSPSSQKYYLRNRASAAITSFKKPIQKVPRFVPYFILHTKGGINARNILKGKRYTCTPFSWKVSGRRLGTLFNCTGKASRRWLVRSYNLLARYRRSEIGMNLGKGDRKFPLRSVFSRGSLGGRFDSTVIINSTLVTLLSQPRLGYLTRASYLSPLTSLPSLYKNLFGSANLAKLLGVGFPPTSLNRKSTGRPARRGRAGSGYGRCPLDVSANLATMGERIKSFLTSGGLPSLASSQNVGEGFSKLLFPFFKQKAVQRGRVRIKSLEAKNVSTVSATGGRGRHFFTNSRLNNYWYLEKRGWLPLIQALDGINRPLSYWPEPEVKIHRYSFPSKVASELSSYKLTLLESRQSASALMQSLQDTAYTSSYEHTSLDLPDPEDWLALEDTKDINQNAYAHYTRYSGMTKRPFVKFYKSLRPGRLLDNLTYPSTFHDIVLTSKSRQYHTFKKLFNYIDWKFLYKRTIFGKRTLSKRGAMFHSTPTGQLSFYASLCDPKTNFFTLNNRGRQTVKNYLCLNNFALKASNSNRFLPSVSGEGSWSLNKIFFINDTLGVSPRIGKRIGSAYIRPDLLTDWIGVSKNIVTTRFSKIDPVSFEDDVKFSGHPALSLVSEISHYHDSSSRYMSTYLSTLFKQRVSGILSIKHAQFGKNR